MNGWPHRTLARCAPAISTVAVLLLLASADASRTQAAAASGNSAEAGFWGELSPASREYRPSRRSTTHKRRAPEVERAPARPQQQSSRTPVRIPRGSGGYVAPVLPEAKPLSIPSIVQPYQPPPTTTFSDRVNNAIQAYPLQKGIGNNPVDQQEFIRQRANQP